jgi:alpha-mannosidase
MVTILANGLPETTGQVAVVAMKKAEDSDEVVLRFQERYGKPTTGLSVRLGVPVLSAREINAAEEEIGPFAVGGNRGGGAGRGAAATAQATSTFNIALNAYQPRAIAMKVQPAWEAASAAQQAAAAAAANPNAGRGGGGGRGGTPPPNVPAPVERKSASIGLPFNLDGVSSNAMRADGDFDGKKHTIAAELFPASLTLNSVPFTLGSTATGAKNVLVPSGQTLAIPAGSYNRVYVLAAAVGGDVNTSFGVGAALKPVTVREWQGPVGQWWSRLKDIAPSLHEPFAVANGNNGLVVSWDPRTGAVTGMDKINPAFVKRDEIAWIGTHRHDPNGDEPYVSSYVFAYGFDLPAGTREIRLPNESRLRILAVTATNDPVALTPAGALYVTDIPEPKVSVPLAPATKPGGRN